MEIKNNDRQTLTKKPRYLCLSRLFVVIKVPLTELFSEPFLRDLDLIWRIDSRIYITEQVRLEIRLATNY